MAAYICKSTDTGAPVLSGTVGALITVLDALLVNGYNAHVSGLSIARSGATATVTKTAHGYITGQRILNAGWDQTEYNIEATVTRIDANSYSYTVAGSPATPGTGTGTSKVAPLGWTKSYTGTNLASYRSKVGTNQFYLGVDDTNAQNSRLRAFEVMTAAGVAVASGTNPFPTDAQLSGGGYHYKSVTANATARTWEFWSNGVYFHLLSAPSTLYCARIGFGDFTSFVAADTFNTLFEVETAASSVSTIQTANHVTGANSGSIIGSFVARKANGAGGSANAPRINPPAAAFGNAVGGRSNVAYPDPCHGGLGMGKSFICTETAYTGPRGILPGFWVALNVVADLDTWSGAAGSPLEGKTFKAYDANVANSYRYTIETTPDLWD